jgi:hypothetical protein
VSSKRKKNPNLVIHVLGDVRGGRTSPLEQFVILPTPPSGKIPGQGVGKSGLPELFAKSVTKK